MKNRIVFTGGGTTGHVTKNLIVMEALKETFPDLELHYLGSASGKEAELISERFHAISTGKLRRYFSLSTIPDFFKFWRGFFQAFFKLSAIKPALIFSSGGYVALPVALAAWLQGISIITHETDSIPGLSSRIMGKFATKVLLGYSAAEKYFSPKKIVVTGNPISPKLFEGSSKKTFEMLHFHPEKPVLLIMGGSQGAEEINQLIEKLLPDPLESFQIIHLTGQGKKIRDDMPGYKAFEYVTEQYPDFLAAADLIISRGGGNSLAEINAMKKPAIIIPLLSAAGNHQEHNALEIRKGNEDRYRMLKNPSPEELLEAIKNLSSAIRTKAAPEKEAAQKSITTILEVITSFLPEH